MLGIVIERKALLYILFDEYRIAWLEVSETHTVTCESCQRALLQISVSSEGELSDMLCPQASLSQLRYASLSIVRLQVFMRAYHSRVSESLLDGNA